MPDLLVAVVVFACILAGAWWLEKQPPVQWPRRLRDVPRFLIDTLYPPK